MGLWSALDHGIITARQARNLHVPALERTIAHQTRWIAHYENRLLYEKAMLDEQGASSLIAPKPRPKQLPLLNYRAPEGITMASLWHRGEMETKPQVEMTKAEYQAIYADWRGTRKVGDHRVRVAILKDHSRVCVFLTDSKTHPRPDTEARPLPELAPIRYASTYTPPERTEFDDLKDSLRAGVKTVSAPQLFPTPPDIALQMIEAAEIKDGDCILEPSAGTGNILDAIPQRDERIALGLIVAVELNHQVASALGNRLQFSPKVGDFLSFNGELGKFDKIIMNPPFANGQDIAHIKHAINHLLPGGRLVALCANGPRQQDRLKPLADHWEELPAGSFRAEGTNVNVAMLVINA
jgi:phospholipid N-methyltransferase